MVVASLGTGWLVGSLMECLIGRSVAVQPSYQPAPALLLHRPRGCSVVLRMRDQRLLPHPRPCHRRRRRRRRRHVPVAVAHPPGGRPPLPLARVPFTRWSLLLHLLLRQLPFHCSVHAASAHTTTTATAILASSDGAACGESAGAVAGGAAAVAAASAANPAASRLGLATVVDGGLEESTVLPCIRLPLARADADAGGARAAARAGAGITQRHICSTIAQSAILPFSGKEARHVSRGPHVPVYAEREAEKRKRAGWRKLVVKVHRRASWLE
jgi:hypothetical protein